MVKVPNPKLWRTAWRRSSAGGRGRFLAKAGILLFFAAFAAIAVTSKNNLHRLAELRTVKRELIQEDLKLVDENKALEQERARLRTPASLEKAARATLGVAKPQETIYVVEESKALPDR